MCTFVNDYQWIIKWANPLNCWLNLNTMSPQKRQSSDKGTNLYLVQDNNSVLVPSPFERTGLSSILVSGSHWSRSQIFVSSSKNTSSRSSRSARGFVQPCAEVTSTSANASAVVRWISSLGDLALWPSWFSRRPPPRGSQNDRETATLSRGGLKRSPESS